MKIEVKISPIPRDRNNVLVLSCPEPSLSGIVAVEYLIDTLRMEELGAIKVEALPPVIAVVEGVAKLPYRLFYSPDTGIIALRQHIPVPPQIYAQFIGKLLEWAEGNNIEMVVCLSAMPNVGEKESDDVYFVTEEQMAERLRGHGLIPIKEGVVSGIEGAFLDAVLSRRIKGVLLLAESKLLGSVKRLVETGRVGTHRDVMALLHDLVGKVGPDAVAALKLIRALSRLVGRELPTQNLEEHASKYSFLVEKNVEMLLSALQQPQRQEIPQIL